MKDKAMNGALPFSLASSPLASKLAINRSLAIVEARRCLQCFDAPCTQACPVHIDIPGFVGRLAQNPIRIGALQFFVARNLRKSEEAGEVRSPKRIAIIGGGPSGLSCATA